MHYHWWQLAQRRTHSSVQQHRRHRHLCTHLLQRAGQLAAAPDFIMRSAQIADGRNPRQLAGAIHRHPKGHVVYISNRADIQGFYTRTFSIDPTRRLLVAASGVDMLVRTGNEIRRVSGGLSVFHIADDGRRTFIRKYDVNIVDPEQQLWVAMMGLPA
jgi:hypothetical protein